MWYNFISFDSDTIAAIADFISAIAGNYSKALNLYYGYLPRVLWFESGLTFQSYWKLFRVVKLFKDGVGPYNKFSIQSIILSNCFIEIFALFVFVCFVPFWYYYLSIL